MRGLLVLEYIGEDYFAYRREPSRQPEREQRYRARFGRDATQPWVARIVGIDPDAVPPLQLQRIFQRGVRDYSAANGTGSRGIMLYYALEDGVYEVHARDAWRRTRRYFVRVDAGQVTEISREEVVQCVSAPSA